MILVYCENISARHRFIFDFIFGDILGIGCELTSDREKFISFNGPKFSYTSSEISDELNFWPHTLLDQVGVAEQPITVTKWKGLPVFFQVDGPSTWPFDPFALSFYLVSRYEEYLPFEPDEHGRFRPELSLAFREGFLQIPLVDAVIHEMRKLMEDKFPGISFSGPVFRFIPSFDIDIAFAHLGKGFTRAAAAWMKLFLKADLGQIRERLAVLTGRTADPYDNFSIHIDLAEKYGHELLYFVLLGDFSQYDRNTSHKGKSFRQLLRRLSTKAEMGIHPSYRSHLRPEFFLKEKKRLETVIEKPVEKNRFHFLRLKFPGSYQILIKEGIKDDYSLGYSSLNGFRAGTATPFLFYDLSKEVITRLRVHPFIFMDSAMIDHLKMSPQEAEAEINRLIDRVKTYGGEAVGIWHNYSLSDKDQYKGWRNVLISILSQNQASSR